MNILAAKAGDAGRGFGFGFGVVATEIRTLSQSSKDTAFETTEQPSAAIQEITASLMEVTTLADELNSMTAYE